MKKYVTTIIKYAFSILLTLFTLKTTKDIRFVLVSFVELLAIFAVSDMLVKKSKWFNVLNDILVLIYNAEQIMLLFSSSYISLVMIQSLTSIEDLQGKTLVYGLGTILVFAFSFVPVVHIEKLDSFKKPLLIMMPILVIADILLVCLLPVSMSPYAGARDLYSQWHDYREMKKMVEQYRQEMSADAGSENDLYSDSYADVTEDSTVINDNGIVETDTINTESNENVVSAGKENIADIAPASDTASENVAGESVVTENTSETTAQSTDANATKTQVTVAPAIDNLSPKLRKNYPVGAPLAHNTLPANTNVIVVFVEGLSNNVITDSRDIMPNMKAFKNECISFSNYYNHTFATYRGIQGQLYSGYSLDDYEVNHLPSVMDVVKSHGYNTVCINVEPSNKAFTNYLNAMAFDKVYSGNGDESGVAGSLSDRQAYSILYDTAKEYNSKGKPFFICMYSFGTHMSFDTDENVYGDGSNNFMNRYYNCDYQIGAFIENFKNSPMAKNTMLIITADHAAYSDEDFVKTFPDYNRAYPACDQIPLYIYYNGLHTSINAGGRNSLCLAPTIIDLLGYERPATFVGYSLYSAKNESTILDSFYWNPDGCIYTGDGSITTPKKDVKEYVNTEVIKYISIK